VTRQFKDRLALRGRTWTIAEWLGDRSVIPSSTSLGFATQPEHTANYAGRIDELAVEGQKLILRRIVATLTDDHHGYTPKGARRLPLEEIEALWLSRSGANLASGHTAIFEVSIPIAFEGYLVLEAEEPEERRVLVLRFRAGALIAERESFRSAAPGEVTPFGAPTWHPEAPRAPADLVLAAVGDHRKDVWRILTDETRDLADVEKRRAWLDHPPSILLHRERTVRAERLADRLVRAGASVELVEVREEA
jgi:hypothetical protein